MAFADEIDLAVGWWGGSLSAEADEVTPDSGCGLMKQRKVACILDDVIRAGNLLRIGELSG